MGEAKIKKEDHTDEVAGSIRGFRPEDSASTKGSVTTYRVPPFHLSIKLMTLRHDSLGPSPASRVETRSPQLPCGRNDPVKRKREMDPTPHRPSIPPPTERLSRRRETEPSTSLPSTPRVIGRRTNSLLTTVRGRENLSKDRKVGATAGETTSCNGFKLCGSSNTRRSDPGT